MQSAGLFRETRGDAEGPNGKGENMKSVAHTILALAVLATPLAAQIRPDSASLPEARRIYSPYVERTEREGRGTATTGCVGATRQHDQKSLCRNGGKNAIQQGLAEFVDPLHVVDRQEDRAVS